MVSQAFDEADVLLLLIISELSIVDILSLVLSTIVDHIPLKVNAEVVVLTLRC